MHTDPEFLNKLAAWQDSCKHLAYYKDLEMKMRKEIFDEGFPEPQEGVNRLDLPGGWKLKGTYKLTRTVDDGVLPTIMQQVRDLGFNADKLIEYKPSLVLKEYKALPTEFTNPETGEVVRPRAVFEQAMTTKPGSPSLELEAPK